ncbi:MAG: CoA-binding protein [Desulfarculus sp.]|nr:CoA-binding protein [Desulfarculus sp.]
MQGFFNPQSAAIIGASADPNKGGHNLVANMVLTLGRRLYPVNPRYAQIDGLPCYPSLAEVPEVPDLVVIFLPPAAVEQALADCARKGVASVMIQSAGMAEVGPEGQALQQRCLALAQAHGMRLWGPNCLGMLDGVNGRVFSFMDPGRWENSLRPGNVSLIVQSGALAGGFLMQVLGQGYFGISKACSLGNRVDVNECDILEHLATDPHTQVVAMYLESLADPARFRRAVENLARPVVLLKGGLSQEGARAALSHTGSLAGNAAIGEGFFRQLGLHRAHDFVELMDLAKALSLWQGRHGGPRVAVMTWSGGAGIVNADHLAAQGLTLASLAPATLERLGRVYPPWMAPGNPADIWPAIERSGWLTAQQETLAALLDDPGVDAVQVHYFVRPDVLPQAREHFAAAAGSSKPVAVWAAGDAHLFDELRRMVEPLGCPVYNEIGRGVKALSLMAKPRRP